MDFFNIRQTENVETKQTLEELKQIDVDEHLVFEKTIVLFFFSFFFLDIKLYIFLIKIK